jgi:hypothetical protein
VLATSYNDQIARLKAAQTIAEVEARAGLQKKTAKKLEEESKLAHVQQLEKAAEDAVKDPSTAPVSEGFRMIQDKRRLC